MNPWIRILLVMLLNITGNAWAGTPQVQLPNQDHWTAEFKSACVEKRDRTTPKIDEVCACLARNIWRMAKLEETHNDSLNDLNWSKEYYSGSISEDKIKSDPLSLVPFLFDFSNACLKNPRYNHDFGPGT